jgi:hypothetical protein
VRRSMLLGRTISDWRGDEVGRVIDTWPFDGGGEPELAVIRLGRMGQRRMVPVDALQFVGASLRLPFERWQIEDSPRIGEDRHTVADDPYTAQSYWRWEEPVISLSAACLLSSGSFATGKLFPMSPSPTPIAS